MAPRAKKTVTAKKTPEETVAAASAGDIDAINEVVNFYLDARKPVPREPMPETPEAWAALAERELYAAWPELTLAQRMRGVYDLLTIKWKVKGAVSGSQAGDAENLEDMPQ